VASADEGRAAVWHLTAWFEGDGPDRRSVIRVEYTTDVNQPGRISEQHAGIGTACASLRRFLEGLVDMDI
jgi:hypothetical protein